jgi:hypothetical protein
VALTAAAVPLWMHLSLLDECRSRVERALAALSAGGSDDPRREVRLLSPIATSRSRRSPCPGPASRKATLQRNARVTCVLQPGGAKTTFATQFAFIDGAHAAAAARSIKGD